MAISNHTRYLIATEIRHRQSGEDPLHFTDKSLKELKAILRAAKGGPLPVVNDPRRQ